MHRLSWLLLGGLAFLLLPNAAARIHAQEAADSLRYSVTYVSVGSPGTELEFAL